MDKILKENLTSLDFRDVMSRPVEMCCFAESVNTLIQNQLFDLIYSYIMKISFLKYFCQDFFIETDQIVKRFLLFCHSVHVERSAIFLRRFKEGRAVLID